MTEFMQVTPASWIKQHMFTSLQEGSRKKMMKRPLTAAEIKVQRSLEKLSIPAWYLNNSSKPPKILMNNTPIELRPSSWKSGTFPKKSTSTTPMILRKYNDSLNNPNINNRSNNNNNNRSPNSLSGRSVAPKKSPKVNLNNTVAVLMETSLDNYRDQDNKAAKLKKLNISKSFPKVSSSRKIQHINIVFPAKKLNESEKIDPSLDQSIPIKQSEVNTANVNNKKPNSSEPRKQETPMLNSTFVKDDSLDIQNISNISKCTSYIDFSWSDFHKSKSNNGSLWVKDLPPKNTIQEESTMQSLDDAYAPKALNNSFGKYLHLCNTSNIKSQSFLKPISEVSESLLPPNCPPPPPPTEISTATFTRSKGKSPILQLKEEEERLEEEQKSLFSGETSLVEDIIEELRRKCTLRSSEAGVTSGSRNFVKKLVRVLEKSIGDGNGSVTGSSNHDNESDDDVIENGYDDDTSSGIISASTSLKNFDIEDEYSRISSSPDYEWSMQANASFEESKYNIQYNHYDDQYDEEEEGFWIPIPKDLPKLPRTSTLLRPHSGSSGQSSGRSSANKSPCLSPIRTGADKFFNYSGIICSTRKNSLCQSYNQHYGW